MAGCVVLPAQAQWEDNGDGSSTLILHPDNDNVIVVDEGPDYIRYGVWYPAPNPSDPDEYIEFDVEKATWNRFDINTTGATDSDEEAWGWPDNRVDVADVRLFYCLYQSGSPQADLNTTGAVSGDSDYGELDGVIDSSDLDFFNAWLSDFHGASTALAMVVDAFSGGDPCTSTAVDEPQLAPRGPGVKSGGESTEVLQGELPTIVKSWRYILARDLLKPQSSLDLIVTHRAQQNEICAGEAGAQHVSDADSELNFIASFGAVAGDITQIFQDRDYEIIEDCLGNGSNIRVGDSTLITMYRMKFKTGLYVPFNVWWAGLGVERNVIVAQRSNTGCSCP